MSVGAPSELGDWQPIGPDLLPLGESELSSILEMMRVNASGSIVVLRDRYARAMRRSLGQSGVRWGPEDDAPVDRERTPGPSPRGSRAGSLIEEPIAAAQRAALTVEQQFSTAARVMSIGSTVTITNAAPLTTATLTTAIYGTNALPTAYSVP